MSRKVVVIRFTWAGVAKAFFLSPLVIIPFSLLVHLPWDSANAPAWVQAVGSVAAIIAAWWIPHQHEKSRVEKQKDELLASVGWLALRISNTFTHMASVIEKSTPEGRDGWSFVDGPLSWKIHRDAAREFPLTGFTHDEISWLLALRSITEFGVLCSETLKEWDFEKSPDLADSFPWNDGLVFHRPQIKWVLKQLSMNEAPQN